MTKRNNFLGKKVKTYEITQFFDLNDCDEAELAILGDKFIKFF